MRSPNFAFLILNILFNFLLLYDFQSDPYIQWTQDSFPVEMAKGLFVQEAMCYFVLKVTSLFD